MAARLYIASGSRKGRRIFAPSGRDVRPSPSRVRMAIFNMLRQEVKGARLLDLFAGTGSIGLEGLSRGAAFCLFVEKAALSLTAIERNIETLGLGEQTLLYRSDAFRCVLGVSRMYEPFDLVILDPPHAFWKTRKRDLLRLIEELRESGAAKPDAVWVIGHPRSAPHQEDLAFLGALDHRGYGEAHVTIVNRRKDDGPAAEVPPEAPSPDPPQGPTQKR